jgi:hypothetical protein
MLYLTCHRTDRKVYSSFLFPQIKTEEWQNKMAGSFSRLLELQTDERDTEKRPHFISLCYEPWDWELRVLCYMFLGCLYGEWINRRTQTC